MSLFQETLELLRRDSGNWPRTAYETGLGREWLSKLAQGRIKEPGVQKIEILHEYLSEKYAERPTDDNTTAAA
jgi:hypothetical protein